MTREQALNSLYSHPHYGRVLSGIPASARTFMTATVTANEHMSSPQFILLVRSLAFNAASIWGVRIWAIIDEVLCVSDQLQRGET